MHLSIIIPAFNEERLIEQCLRSVAASTAANATPGFTSEVIVVDNNSTDKTAELARQAGTQVVFEPINQIGRARNAGAAQATGEWPAESWPACRHSGDDWVRKVRGMWQHAAHGRLALVGKSDTAVLDQSLGSQSLGRWGTSRRSS
jgi:glycosyltransferase involved in cell wall biosynthesis